MYYTCLRFFLFFNSVLKQNANSKLKFSYILPSVNAFAVCAQARGEVGHLVDVTIVKPIHERFTIVLLLWSAQLRRESRLVQKRLAG